MTSLIDLIPIDGADSTSDATKGAALIGWRGSNVGAYLDSLSNLRTINNITATSAGQTTFTVPGGYVVGQIDVFLNGFHLTNGIDCIATTGTTVVLQGSILISSVSVGSVMVVSAISGSAIANAITAPQLAASNGAGLVGYGATTVAAQLATGVFTGTAAGGDLSGTYPNPTVSKINGVAYTSVGLPVSYATGTNVTIPVVSYSASTSNTGTNVDISLIPSGTGSVLAAVPDGTAVGGNKRGTNSVDLQLSRSTAVQVASGANSFAVGQANTVSGTGAIGAGYNNTSTNSYCVALGNGNQASNYVSVAIGNGHASYGQYSLALGTSCTSYGTASAAIGQSCTASAQAALAMGFTTTASGYASSAFGAYSTTNGIKGQVALGHASNTLGRFQRTFTQVYALTTSTTATVATADGASAATSNQLTLRNSSAVRVRMLAVAFDTTNGTDAKEWTSDILVIRGASAAATSIVGSPTVTSTFATAGSSGWTVAVAVDTTNGALKVTVTSSSTDAVHWNIQLDAIEVM